MNVSYLQYVPSSLRTALEELRGTERLPRENQSKGEKNEKICVQAELQVLKDGQDIYSVMSVISMHLIQKTSQNHYWMLHCRQTAFS